MNQQITHLKAEIAKHVIGHTDLIDKLLIGLISDGHVLIEGVPGLAKTTAVNALAKAIGLDFKRVQFTADLLPSDILGAEVYQPKTESFMLKKGPIFTNLLLCDEINRASAKVQSALLEVMQEKQVTLANESFALEEPFFVLATQNPIDQEGTYSLPEAQLDRFMMKVIVDYNSEDEEFEIAKKAANQSFAPINKVLSPEVIGEIKKQVKEIYVDDALTTHIVKLIFATRDPKKYGLSSLIPLIEYGASPRATIDMLKAVKASAYIRGNDTVTPVDIALCFHDVLRHRIVLSYDAEAEGHTSDEVLDTILQTLEMP
ncbi:MAG TPA: AAA family ATPase [Epsilonproteobacteria bacterium]|nr:AAA family ATPase [Campylobacterota bacterium]